MAGYVSGWDECLVVPFASPVFVGHFRQQEKAEWETVLIELVMVCLVEMTRATQNLGDCQLGPTDQGLTYWWAARFAPLGRYLAARGVGMTVY